MDKKEILVAQEEQETVMALNETCSDCYYFDPSDSVCTYSGRVPTDPDRSKCRNFSLKFFTKQGGCERSRPPFHRGTDA